MEAGAQVSATTPDADDAVAVDDQAVDPPPDDDHGPDPTPRPPRRRRGGRGQARRATDPQVAVLALLAGLPILAATIVALTKGWTPLGDNATIAMRSGDVLRGRPPLVGMPSTSDMVRAGVRSDHPGPLEFYALALPGAILGPAGLVLAIAAANIGACWAAIGIAWRRGGKPLATLTTGLVLVLCLTLGSTIIRDPLNSHAGLLPFLWVVLAAWDLTLGRLRSAPWAVVAATWCAQLHVVFLPTVAVLGLGVVVLTVRELDDRTLRARRRGRRRLAARERAARRRSLGLAAAVGVLLWLPPLIDQVGGTGNLGKLASVGGQDGQGVAFGLRALVRAFGTPPAFLRLDSWPLLALEGPGPADWAMALLTVALVIAVARDARTRRDHALVRLLQVDALVVAGTFLTLVRTPLGGAVLAADPLHLLWPVTGLVWAGIAWGGWRSWEDRRALPTSDPDEQRAPAGRRQGALVAIGLVASLAVTTVTVTRTRTFGGFGEGLMDPVAAVEAPTIAAARGHGTAEVAVGGWASRLYGRAAVLEALERAGIPTQTPDRDHPSQRFADGRRPGVKVWVLSGATVPRQPAPNARLVAKANLRSSLDWAHLSARRARLRHLLDERGTVVLRDGPRIRLRDLGREYFRWEDPPQGSRATIPAAWLSTDAYVDLYRAGMIAAPKAEQRLVDELFADSVGRYFVARDQVLAVYVLPLED